MGPSGVRIGGGFHVTHSPGRGARARSASLNSGDESPKGPGVSLAGGEDCFSGAYRKHPFIHGAAPDYTSRDRFKYGMYPTGEQQSQPFRVMQGSHASNSNPDLQGESSPSRRSPLSSPRSGGASPMRTGNMTPTSSPAHRLGSRGATTDSSPALILSPRVGA